MFTRAASASSARRAISGDDHRRACPARPDEGLRRWNALELRDDRAQHVQRGRRLLAEQDGERARLLFDRGPAGRHLLLARERIGVCSEGELALTIEHRAEYRLSPRVIDRTSVGLSCTSFSVCCAVPITLCSVSSTALRSAVNSSRGPRGNATTPTRSSGARRSSSAVAERKRSGRGRC